VEKVAAFIEFRRTGCPSVADELRDFLSPAMIQLPMAAQQLIHLAIITGRTVGLPLVGRAYSLRRRQ
jgi:hypothetical protein